MRLPGVILVSLCAAVGCSSVPEQTFNQERAAVRSIAIAQPFYQEELMLRYRNDQLETVDVISPVPIGRLFAYVAKEKREAEFTELAETATSALANDFKNALDTELASLNVDTVRAGIGPDEDMPRTRYNLLKKIPAAAFNGADALLETSGQIGFIAAGRGKPYQPALWILVRMTQRDGTTVLQDRIIYNPVESNNLGIMLYPTDTYMFDTRDDLLDSAKATEALREATSTVAQELVFLLKGQAQDVN